MRLLVSALSPEEARAAALGGADILDIKNVGEGSLGASFPWIIRAITHSLRGRAVTFSATLGDLPFKPGTAALAALGAAVCGVSYIKAGLHGVRGYEEALSVMKGIVRACKDYDPRIAVVAVGYADYRRFGGIDPRTLVRAGRDSGSDLVMVDTAIKDGTTLFDALSQAELEEFIGEAHANRLQAALAGSLRPEHLERLRRLRPDIIGVRGCVCSADDRTCRIEVERVRRFVAAAKEAAAS